MASDFQYFACVHFVFFLGVHFELKCLTTNNNIHKNSVWVFYSSSEYHHSSFDFCAKRFLVLKFLSEIFRSVWTKKKPVGAEISKFCSEWRKKVQSTRTQTFLFQSYCYDIFVRYWFYRQNNMQKIDDFLTKISKRFFGICSLQQSVSRKIHIAFWAFRQFLFLLKCSIIQWIWYCPFCHFNENKAKQSLSFQSAVNHIRWPICYEFKPSIAAQTISVINLTLLQQQQTTINSHHIKYIGVGCL